VSGRGNRIEHCEIGHSAGNGVWLGGVENALVNSHIHHANSMGAYCAPLTVAGFRHLVSHNTIEYAGRDCIKINGAEHLVAHNDVGYAGRICHDQGLLYGGGLDGGNTRIVHNFFHNNPGGNISIGIYLDNYMKNFIVAHNVVWNVGQPIRMNRPTQFCMVYNNTLFGLICNDWGPWDGQYVQWGTHIFNNLVGGEIQAQGEVVQRNNFVHFDVSRAFDTATRSAPKTWTPPDLGVPPGGSRAGESTFLGALHPANTEARVGHDFPREITPEYRPAREPLRNWLRNTAFEYAIYHEEIGNEVNPLLHWRRIGDAEVEFHPGFNDPPANERDSILNNSVRLPGGGDNGIAQTVEGLLHGVEYVLSGYAKHPDGGSVEFAVRSEGENLVLGRFPWDLEQERMGGGATWW
jgi:hypothetical protein